MELDSFFLEDCPLQSAKRGSLPPASYGDSELRGSFSSSDSRGTCEEEDLLGDDFDFACLNDISLDPEPFVPAPRMTLARCESSCELLVEQHDSSAPSSSDESSATTTAPHPTAVDPSYLEEFELAWCDTTSPRGSSSTPPSGGKRQRAPEQEAALEALYPRRGVAEGCSHKRRDSSESISPVLSSSVGSDATVPFLEGPEPSLGVRITQGVAERADQWLRSMDRLTFFNVELELGKYGALAPEVAKALAGCEPRQAGVEMSLACHLMYADTHEIVALKHEKACQERISLISAKGNTKAGVSALDTNGIHLSSTTRLGAAAFPTEQYLAVKPEGSSVRSTFKFSTNVTSRRHGKRNDGRKFYWRLQMVLTGVSEAPVCLAADSHVFGYISRPTAASTPGGGVPEGSMVSLVDLASDNRPGDMITCVGENLHTEAVSALIGQGDAVVAALPRVRPSKHAFVGRLPDALAAGVYWIQLSNSTCSTEKVQLTIKSQ